VVIRGDKARKGDITQFPGIDDPYETPDNPEIIVDTTNITVDKAVKSVLRKHFVLIRVIRGRN